MVIRGWLVLAVLVCALAFTLSCGEEDVAKESASRVIKLSDGLLFNQDTSKVEVYGIDSCTVAYMVKDSEFEFTNYCDTGYVFYFNDSTEHLFNVETQRYLDRWKGSLGRGRKVGEASMSISVEVPELPSTSVSCLLEVYRLGPGLDSVVVDREVFTSQNTIVEFEKSREEVDSIIFLLSFTNMNLGLTMPPLSAKYVFVQNEKGEIDQLRP